MKNSTRLISVMLGCASCFYMGSCSGSPRPVRAATAILVGVPDIVQLGLEMGKMEVRYGGD